MKIITVINIALACLFSLPTNNATAYEDPFSETLLIDAFEKGRSLVIAEVLSIQSKQEQHGNFYCYTVKIVQPVVMGDLSVDDLASPVQLFAGASFGSSLRIGATYAIFIIKDKPLFISWAHRGAIWKIDKKRKKEVDVFISKAKQVYEKTLICKFRNAEIGKLYTPADIPDELKRICNEFKKKGDDRVELAKAIFQSDLGSRPDESNKFSSVRIYLPPKVLLSRSQVLHLFGEPTLKLGRTYYWFCGEDDSASPEYTGILTATFDRDENLIRLIYGLDKMIKWKKHLL